MQGALCLPVTQIYRWYIIGISDKKFDFLQISAMYTTERGFTLHEAILCLMITGLALTLAIPSFAAFASQARLSETSTTLVANLNYARSLAISKNRTVYVCALNAKANLDIQGCSSPSSQQTSSTWDEGLLLYADRSDGRPKQYDSQEMLRHILWQGTVSVRAQAPQLAFTPEGRLDSTHDFILREATSGECRTIHLNSTGRARACNKAEVRCDAC